MDRGRVADHLLARPPGELQELAVDVDHLPPVEPDPEHPHFSVLEQVVVFLLALPQRILGALQLGPAPVLLHAGPFLVQAEDRHHDGHCSGIADEPYALRLRQELPRGRDIDAHCRQRRDDDGKKVFARPPRAHEIGEDADQERGDQRGPPELGELRPGRQVGADPAHHYDQAGELHDVQRERETWMLPEHEEGIGEKEESRDKRANPPADDSVKRG